jgi:hypothetical protein
MNINEDRVEEIFQELCDQLEKITVGELKDGAYKILERRAEFHESEERRAKEKLRITFNELKQEEVYREINLKKNRATAKAEAYKRAKQGV